MRSGLTPIRDPQERLLKSEAWLWVFFAWASSGVIFFKGTSNQFWIWFKGVSRKKKGLFVLSRGLEKRGSDAPPFIGVPKQDLDFGFWES